MAGLSDVIKHEILPVVSKVAPLLGSVLGSNLADVGISLIAQAFGVTPSDISKLDRVIANDPEAAIKLRTLEYEHAATLAKIAAQNYQTEVDDRKNARDMKSIVPHILAFCFLIIYSFVQYEVINHPGEVDDIISARVQDILIMVFSYYFGSAFKNFKEERL